MQLRALLNEDDAVSPVIGVILMVAITVILAAVIASFVLGLGGSADEVQPNTSLDFDYDGVDDVLEITVTSGDSLDTEVVWLRGDFSSEESVDGTLSDLDGGDIDVDGDELSSGQGVTIEAGAAGAGELSEYDLSVVWDTGDDSATLASNSGPDA